MAKAKSRKTSRAKARTTGIRPVRFILRQIVRAVSGVFLLLVALILLFAAINPPITHTMWAEKKRLGNIDHEWVPFEEITPEAVRAVVAAEDANFCRHWGFDMMAIRAALNEGAQRGGSTISQQTVKNVFLWQGRNWTRKALETLITPLVELLWSKRRILEVYLNVAEFDEGVFGIDAAAYHYFRVAPDQLTAAQAAKLAVILPNPKRRDAAHLSPVLKKRAQGVADGAATIFADGRSSCFDG